MDIFRKHLDKRAGPGGVKCPCCGDSDTKGKKKSKRAIRRVLKLRLRFWKSDWRKT